MISRLQYISQEIGGKTHLENIEEACKAGVNWVQLRIKNKPLEEIESIAADAKIICKKFGARLVINDHVEIAKSVKANGVHLGKEDMDPLEARRILGERPYIGGTANTWDDILRLKEAEVDYIGLGPFKFTETKENLSPELGVKGYSNIMNHMIIEDMDIPIVAIGGIELDDIFDLQMTGIYGIAVASLINQAKDKSVMVEEVGQLLLMEEGTENMESVSEDDESSEDFFEDFNDEYEY